MNQREQLRVAAARLLTLLACLVFFSSLTVEAPQFEFGESNYQTTLRQDVPFFRVEFLNKKFSESVLPDLSLIDVEVFVSKVSAHPQSQLQVCNERPIWLNSRRIYSISSQSPPLV